MQNYKYKGHVIERQLHQLFIYNIYDNITRKPAYRRVSETLAYKG